MRSDEEHHIHDIFKGFGIIETFNYYEGMATSIDFTTVDCTDS